MKTIILNLFALFILFSSCKYEIIVDNPKNEKIQVSIDQKDYELNAHSTISVQLSKGEHNIKSSLLNGDNILDTSVVITQKGLLNVTNTTYVLWTDLYCEEKDYNTFKSKLDLKDTVKIDELEFIEIDFEFLTGVFIKKKWDYTLDEQMPDTVDISENEKYKIASKLYRPADIKAEFNYVGDIDFEGMTEEEIENILETRNNEN